MIQRENEDRERKLKKCETLEGEIEHLRQENQDKERKLEKVETLAVEIDNLRLQNQNKERKLKKLESENEDIFKRNSCHEKMICDSKKALLANTNLLRSQLEPMNLN